MLSRPDPGAFARLAPLWIALFSAGALGVAYVAQYGFGLQPCELCLIERWPYRAAILLAAVALLFRLRPPWRAMLVFLCSLTFLIGAGVAAFHVGVEQHLWAGTAACTGNPAPNSLAALRAQIMQTPVARCDQPALVVLGLSIAGWNFVASVLLFCASLIAALRLQQAR
jgi:disulfide bond formation protein DsbB